MAGPTTDSILTSLIDLVGDQFKVVTYKWLARHHNIPYDTAKRILFEFMTQNGQKIQATFLLSGWTKGGAAAQHVVRVVDAQALDAAKAQLGVITALHVYSVQPSLAKDSSDLYNADYAQTEGLFRQLLSPTEAGAEANPLAANLLSAVQCAAARRDPKLAAQRPRPAVKPPAAAPSPAAKLKAKNKMEQMWAKASPAKSKSKPAPSRGAAAKAPAPPKAAPQLDPEFAIEVDSNSSDSSSSSSSSSDDDGPEEQPAAMARPAAKGRATQMIDDSESDEEFKEPPAKQAKQTKAPAKKPAAAKPKPPAAKKPPAAAKRKQPAGGEQGGPCVDARPRKSKSKAAAPAKRRMMKTYFNDAGEEVTEMVDASDDEAGATEAEPAPSAAPEPAAPQPAPEPAQPAPPVQQKAIAAAPKPAGGKKAASKASAASGSRNIMSFFGKK